MRESQRNYKRIVLKFGSSLLYKEDKLDVTLLRAIAEQISGLIKDGNDLIIVSSGAIALGMSILKLTSRPKELAYLQAAAAVGQHELMDIWRSSLKEEGHNCAQVLLTWDDFNSRQRYLNAKNTLLTLLKLNCVPVINENDTVSTEEIKFGDNDRLSALVATLVGADLLIILSDVDGLLDREKNIVKVVEKITPAIKALACPTAKARCVGGMITKLEAAGIAAASGIPCVIANGRESGVISESAKNPGALGTLFAARGKFLEAKKRWIAFGSKVKGKIIVDDGAKRALMNKKSLLSVGVIAVEGNFSSGDIVSLRGLDNCEFARGRVAISGKELEKIKGERSEKEVVHRDNIVIL